MVGYWSESHSELLWLVEDSMPVSLTCPNSAIEMETWVHRISSFAAHATDIESCHE